MADLALLLLVFFMASTTTEPPKGVEVELPSAFTSGAEQDSVYITISSSGRYYIDGSASSLPDISDRLVMRRSEKDRAVSVTADRNIDYRVVSKLLNVLTDQDFLNIVFMSQPSGTAENDQ